MRLDIPNGLFLLLGIILIILSIGIYYIKLINNVALDRECNERNLLKWSILNFFISGVSIIIISILARMYSYINSSVIVFIVICLMSILIGIGYSKYEF